MPRLLLPSPPPPPPPVASLSARFLLRHVDSRMWFSKDATTVSSSTFASRSPPFARACSPSDLSLHLQISKPQRLS